MHPTTHPPTPHQQIKRLLTLLALSVVGAVVTVGSMVYTSPTERSHLLTDVLIAPETLPRIAWQEPSSLSTSSSHARMWHFDSMVLSFFDTDKQQLTTRTLSSTDYAGLYAQLASDSSLNEAQRLHIENSAPNEEQPMQLSIWLTAEGHPFEHRLLQSVLFLPQTNLYRVQLYKTDRSTESSWVNYYHEGLSSLLQPLTQEVL